MTIAVGERLPEAVLTYVSESGPAKISTKELFGGKKIVLFGLPGAFTGTCSTKHIPGYVENYEAFVDAGVDTIALITVNDVFVLQAWQKSTGAEKILHLADWDVSFLKAAGLDIDLGASTLGVRSKRFSMIVEDGIVTSLEIEKSPGEVTVSSAESTLSRLAGKSEGEQAA